MSLTTASPLARRRRTTRAALLGIGAATPPALSQEEILRLAVDISRAKPEHEAWLTRVFRSSGIRQRGVVLADAENSMQGLRTFYPASASDHDAGPTTGVRMERYAIEAPLLAAAAVRQTFLQTDIKPDEITHLFTASCTGFFAPGLDAALIERFDLSPDIRRLHIGFMGCHAAFNLLAAARDVIRADPRAKALVCCVELCSLHMAYGWDPGKLIANALFADGAAAAIIGATDRDSACAWNLCDTASALLPDTQDAMTWRIGDHGFEMTLSPGLPNLIRQQLGLWCENWLAKKNLKISDIANWAIHPGGPKILDAVAEALGLSDEALAPSRKILAEHGNMSSATILFILQNMRPGPCVAIGLGPGLMVEGMLLNV